MKLKVYALSALFGLFSPQLLAQFITTNQFNNPTGVSNSGSVVGYFAQGDTYYLWDADANKVKAIEGTSPGQGHGSYATFSLDNKFISGASINPETGLSEISRYEVATNKWTLLGGLGGVMGKASSGGYDISADGSTIIGLGWTKQFNANAIAWTQNEGIIDLGSLHKGRSSRANEVSADGSIIVGWQDQFNPWKAAVWKKNPNGGYFPNVYLLIDPKGDPTDLKNQLGEAHAISADGKWIGGKGDEAMANAWLWSEETGMIDLGRFEDDDRARGNVTSINHDGTIAVGYYMTYKNGTSNPPDYKCFIWTKKNGIKELNDFVKNDLKFETNQTDIYVPIEISPNGKYITGWGVYSKKEIVSIRIQLPEDFLSTEQVTAVQNKMSIYPNPSSDFFKIDIKETILDVKVYNQTGQLVNVQKMSDNKYNVTGLPKGVYIVSVQTSTTTQSTKLIIK